jgi:large subunit ribosomal protein L15
MLIKEACKLVEGVLKMKLSELPKTAGRSKKVKRLGCGRGSGHGKTSSRGNKGGNARSGYTTPTNFSGIPIYRRFPKRGFNNAKFKMRYQLVSLADLEEKLAQDFSGIVDRNVLFHAGLVNTQAMPIKLLGNGEVARAFSVKVDKITAGAKSKLEAVGGQFIAM